MKRYKPYRVKSEKPETSSAGARDAEEHDLAYYIHDRVELMHQVFSVLKHKELRAIAPECVRRLSIDDLQELCTEELLGISSKRLLAILDGAEPPSDTESSSSEPLETVSLDSISSGEELLSQGSGGRRKHKHRRSSKKRKRRSSTTAKATTTTKANTAAANVITNAAVPSHAGVTVLELLELQARARAIRAQLQQHGTIDSSGKSPVRADDDDVMIKEEPPEVVEISSDDDEKPKATSSASTSKTVENGHTADPDKAAKDKKKKRKEKRKDGEKVVAEKDKIADAAVVNKEVSNTVTKKINDLVITVPQQPTRRIKLNRGKAVLPVAVTSVATTDKPKAVEEKAAEEKTIAKAVGKKQKAKKDKKRKRKSVDNKEGSDHDEITLQLSDSEKMDLLEDFNYEKVTSSTSDSDSSSDSESDSSSENENKTDDTIQKALDTPEKNKDIAEKVKDTFEKTKDIADKLLDKEDKGSCNNKQDADIATEEEGEKTDVIEESSRPGDVIKDKEENPIENVDVNEISEPSNEISEVQNRPQKENEQIEEENIVVTNIEDIPVQEDKYSESRDKVTENIVAIVEVDEKDKEMSIDAAKTDEKFKSNVDKDESVVDHDQNVVEKPMDVEIVSEDNVKEKDTNNDASEGEISEHSSSEVEAMAVEPEIVCISDDEDSKKKKKKKDKKAKKEKKAKKKSDFRDAADENFFRENVDGNLKRIEHESIVEDTDKKNIELIVLDDDEVFELSDSSSCYEVEGTVLSKEPTVEEIEALSAKIDEIEREDVITDEQIRQHERKEAERDSEENLDNISWKDRYLDSNKVKKVLSTANILNALRKKNKQLKKMVEENKKKETETPIEKSPEKEKDAAYEEGTIEQYNTLQGSTKYVDPVVPPKEKEIEIQVTGEMKKDAKLLLKMYRKLLKYNDLTKQKDPNKKKKKKRKKEKDGVASDANKE